MQYLEDFLLAEDGHEIPIRVWRPNSVDKILVIAHGMAEYCERYAALADWLTDSQIAVIALNHRGHGMDCADEDLGHFADQNGWDKVIADLHTCIQYIKAELPDIPVTLLGHSMGSFISQAFIQRHGDSVDQLILSATNRAPKLQRRIERSIIRLMKTFKGPRHRSALVDKLSFAKFNRAFAPNRTAFDWLTRSENQVDAYIEDPYCGFICSLGLWDDLLTGLLSIDTQAWPPQLPVHLLSGSDDPVGEMGKGICELANDLAEQNKLASFKLYPGARHELVNETNFEEVWQDIRARILAPTSNS